MARHLVSLAVLSIANGGTASPAISSLERSKVALGMSIGMTIHAPAALTGVVTVQVHPAAEATWRTLQSAGADVTIAAGKTIVLSPVPVSDLRLFSTLAEGAQRDFYIEIQEEGV